jgi:energy-coupling factor transport system permease protein
VHALRNIAIPVMEDALERSLRLAAAMDSRGYGRTGTASRRARRATGAVMLAGMCGLCIGVYGLLDSSVPGPLGLPALLGGSALCLVGLAIGSRRVGATRYRPDPWRAPEWIVAASGIVPAVVFVVGFGVHPGSLNPSTDPLVWSTLPLLPTLAVLVALVPAIAAPPPLRAAAAVEVETSRSPVAVTRPGELPTTDVTSDKIDVPV